jgi:hypothetical protein
VRGQGCLLQSSIRVNFPSQSSNCFSIILLSGHPSEHLRFRRPVLSLSSHRGPNINVPAASSSLQLIPLPNSSVCASSRTFPTPRPSRLVSPSHPLATATSTTPSAHSGRVHAPSAHHVRNATLLAPLSLARSSHSLPHPIPRTRLFQSRVTLCGRPSPRPHPPRHHGHGVHRATTTPAPPGGGRRRFCSSPHRLAVARRVYVVFQVFYLDVTKVDLRCCICCNDNIRML